MQKTYSEELRSELVKKMMPPNHQSIYQISKESGISTTTLYNWKKRYQSKGYVMPNKTGNAENWDNQAKLAVIIETASMNTVELSTYCREKGLYAEQIDAWRVKLLDLLDKPVEDSTVSKVALANERKKTKRLEKELLRKERALAEAAALLTLSKKAQAIWGNLEED